MKLINSRDCNGKGTKALCKLTKSLARFGPMVTAAMEEEKKKQATASTKKVIGKGQAKVGKKASK